MMGKTLQLNFKYVKPSLLKGPFRYSTIKKTSTETSDEEDVPDLASSSCASDHESNSNNKGSQVPQEAMLGDDSDVSESHNDDNDEDHHDDDDELPQDGNDYDDESSANDSIIPPFPLQSSLPQASSTSDLVFAELTQQEEEEEDFGIATDREQRMVVPHCIPANIVLVSSSNNYEYQQSDDESSLEDRLEHAEALVHSYQDTIRSNEHLIESLHNTIAKTREEAFHVMSSHKELEQTVEMLIQEREEHETMMIPEPQLVMKMAMAFTLFLYFLGFTSEYPLIATVMVFLLEGAL